MLILSVVSVLGVVAAGVGYNYFQKFFFNALQALDKPAILNASYFFLIDRSFMRLQIAFVKSNEVGWCSRCCVIQTVSH